MDPTLALPEAHWTSASAAASLGLMFVAGATCAGTGTTAPGPANDVASGSTMQTPLLDEFHQYIGTFVVSLREAPTISEEG